MSFRSADPLPFKVFVPRGLRREVHGFATREEQVEFVQWLAARLAAAPDGLVGRCGCGCCGWHDTAEVTNGR